MMRIKKLKKGKTKMINKKLNIGDYIFTPSGKIARIIRVNKATYGITELVWERHDTINFKGIVKNYFGEEEWFECEEPQAKALELAFRKYLIYEENKKIMERSMQYINEAKAALKKISQIEFFEDIKEDIE